MKLNGKYLFVLFIFTLCAMSVKAQDLVSDIATPVDSITNSELFTENIQLIGRSRKVFIITNSNQMMSKGDFITLVLNFKDPVARAVVAKNHEGLVGVKILKIYSLKAWSQIRQGMDIQILRGDDSSLFAPKQEIKAETPEDVVKIEGEEDLFNDKDLFDDELSGFGKENRHIKPDNLVNAFWAQYRYKDKTLNEEASANQFGGGWGFQFQDNFWIEGIYGRILLNDVPAKSKQTLVNNLTLRIKYTFKAPLYSFILPYIGYQYYYVNSPEAGDETSSIIDERETSFVKSLGERKIVGGVTIMRRLVPGWFIKADLGSDIINVGFAIEF